MKKIKSTIQLVFLPVFFVALMGKDFNMLPLMRLENGQKSGALLVDFNISMVLIYYPRNRKRLELPSKPQIFAHTTFFRRLINIDNRAFMVLKDSKANLKAALATFVISDKDRKSGRSNQGSEVKTALQPGSVFWSDNGPGLSLLLPERFQHLSSSSGYYKNISGSFLSRQFCCNA
jgi:hypothetical protein